ncbi:MAG: hypothetical protein E7660_06475 [Ruminococcaceae bacterium]|nr:hypothetical protein [Oscillospiraceae bacterium]
MDIIGNIKETISKTGRSAVKKTKDLAGLARINARIEETKELIEGVYAQIGRKYYDLYSKGGASEEFAIDIATIENLTEQLEAFEQEKLVLKGKIRCAECGKTGDDGYTFCPFCGAKFPETPAPEEAVVTEPVVEDEDFEDADEEIE